MIVSVAHRSWFHGLSLFFIWVLVHTVSRHAPSSRMVLGSLTPRLGDAHSGNRFCPFSCAESDSLLLWLWGLHLTHLLELVLVSVNVSSFFAEAEVNSPLSWWTFALPPSFNDIRFPLLDHRLSHWNGSYIVWASFLHLHYFPHSMTLDFLSMFKGRLIGMVLSFRILLAEKDVALSVMADLYATFLIQRL